MSVILASLISEPFLLWAINNTSDYKIRVFVFQMSTLRLPTKTMVLFIALCCSGRTHRIGNF